MTMRLLLVLGIALTAATCSCLALSTTQHRVQSGNGKGNMIRAIHEKRLGEYLTNRVTARFALNRPLTSGMGSPSAPDASSSTSVGLGQQDIHDMFWLGNITIGTPDQGPFPVQFDTGSSDLWVVDSTCGTIRSTRTKKQCATVQMFNSSTSSSYAADGMPFGIRYMDGSYAIGFQAFDTVKIVDSSGNGQLIIPNTRFAQAYDLDMGTLGSTPGLFGLGFQCDSVNYVVPPFINAVQQGLLSQPIFTIYLETLANETTVDDAPAGGVITFGGLDSTNCGDVVDWIDLTSTSGYQFAYDKMNVGSLKVATNGGDVIVDSGTSLLIGDSNVVAPIAKAAGAKYFKDWNVYTIKCDASYNSLTFVINGTSYSLSPSVLNIDVGIGSNTCLFGAVPMDKLTYYTGLDWILGDPFIRQWCAVHNVVTQQIGFAPALSLQQ